MDYKYIILDFGNVIAASSSGDWNITPKFLELIDIDKLDMNRFNELLEENKHILNEKILTLEEEYNMFVRFYDNILSKMDYPNYNINISEQLAHYRTYDDSRYFIFDNIFDELTKLKGKYKLLLLTDNWPCVISYLKHCHLYDFFDKVYVSSIYGYLKKDKVLFDYPIKDYNIKEGEALFIDVLLIDRFNKVKDSKYKIINDLYDI